ncbi:MAG: hypothetical protein IPQ21_20035 [Betaproteobacteria bacterium]|nr:hypothetical protein [Betaproteobacteria bacterium]
MTGRKVLSHPPGQGQATVAETHADAEVLRLTEQFFAGTQLSGPAAGNSSATRWTGTG